MLFYRKNTFVHLTYGELVMHRQRYLAYGFYEFLIDVGSSLGLWLGLSVFGIVDMGLDVFVLVKQVYSERFNVGV